MAGLQPLLLRQAGPTLQQLLCATLELAAAQEGCSGVALEAAQHERQQQHAHARGLRTTAAASAPRFHENLRLPQSDPLYSRDNYKALKASGWDVSAAAPLLRGEGGARPKHGGGAAAAAAAASTRLVRECESLADLKAVVEERGHGFDGVALAAAVCRVPKVMRGSTTGAERLLDRLMPQLLALVAGGGGGGGGGGAGGGGLRARELSNVLWAVSKAGYPLDPSEVSRLVGALAPQLKDAAPRELSMAAVAAARLAPGSDAFWGALEAPAAAALSAAAKAGEARAEAAAAAAAWASARAAAEEGEEGGEEGGARAARRRRRREREQPEVRYTGPQALEAAAAERGSSPAGGAAQAAANLAWAHARVGRAPRALVEAVDAWLVAGGGARDLNPRELSMLAWAAARWARAAGGGGGGSGGGGAGGEAAGGGGAGGGGGGGGAALSGEAVSLLLDASADKLWQFSGGELNGLLLAASRLRAEHPPLLAALAKQLDHPEAAAGAPPAALAAALSAAARAGSDGGRALLRAAAAVMAAAPGSFSPADAANVAWAAAAMGLSDDAFYEAALARVAAGAGECSGRELAHALLGACAARGAGARARLAAAAAPAAAARAAEGGLAPRDAAAALRVLAAAAARGELEGHIEAGQLRAAAEAIGDSVLAQYRAGGVQRSEADDVAASLEALCGAGHAAAAVLRGGGGGGGGEAGADAGGAGGGGAVGQGAQ